MTSQVKVYTPGERLALQGKLEKIEADLLAYEMGRKRMRASHARALSAKASKLAAQLAHKE